MKILRIAKKSEGKMSEGHLAEMKRRVRVTSEPMMDTQKQWHNPFKTRNHNFESWNWKRRNGYARMRKMKEERNILFCKLKAAREQSKPTKCGIEGGWVHPGVHQEWWGDAQEQNLKTWWHPSTQLWVIQAQTTSINSAVIPLIWVQEAIWNPNAEPQVRAPSW